MKKAKVVDYHDLKPRTSAPGVPEVQPDFIVFPFFDKEDGATISMRMHINMPGGKIKKELHTHPWEHQTYTLAGEGVLVTEDGELRLKEGLVAFVPANLPHIMENRGYLPHVAIDVITTV